MDTADLDDLAQLDRGRPLHLKFRQWPRISRVSGMQDPADYEAMVVSRDGRAYNNEKEL
jgi:hypothetical protein